MSIEKGQTRRVFQVGAIYGLWALITGALALPAAIYLLSPLRSRSRSAWTDLGEVGQFKPNQPEEVVFRRNRVDGWKVSSEKVSAWVVNSGKELIAFAPSCTHLGCAYHWDQKNGNFLCPCHTSTFGLDGKVLTGPAPRPLDRFETKTAGGHLLLGEELIQSES
ncbi:MAG TPA: ubiquinol-cytochrome c reductase iron-sulfur subunit [Bryobacteraceae bacterium]|jgi:menaquinol-cytochrome c reductase iron-sulfur subunit|nr:ubiquinol-cytochrome c reductase iron-sulfur subunit [Bryobacteraceae bacterium]